MSQEFEFVEQLRKKLAPLRVTVDLELEDHCFYLIIDGTASYEDPADWIRKWTSFFNFASANAYSHYGVVWESNPNRAVLITPTRIKFTIGSLMDILKNA